MDTVPGTAGNDSIGAGLTTTSQQTLTTGDSLDGGAGTDTLDVTLNGGFVVLPSAMKSIENINVANITANSGIDFSTSSGVKAINVIGTTAATSLTNVNDLNTAISLTGTQGATTISYDPISTAGTTDAVTISSTNAANVTVDYAIETVNFNVTKNTNGQITQNYLQKIVASGGGADAGSVTIVGDAVYGGVIDASGVVGATTISSGAASVNITGGSGNDTVVQSATTGTGSHRINTGTGDDVIVLGSRATSTGAAVYTGSSGNVSITAGAGSDIVQFYAGFGSGDTVDGGDGTDTLVLNTPANFTGTLASTHKYLTGFEAVSLSDAGATLLSATFTGISTSLKNFGTGVASLSISDYDVGSSTTRVGQSLFANAANNTFNFNAGSSTLSLTGDSNPLAGGGDVTLTLTADGTGTTDALRVNFANYDAGVARKFTQDSAASAATAPIVTATGIESLRLHSTTRTSATDYNTFGAISVSGTGGAETTVTFTGTSVQVASVSANKVDASGMTINADEAGLRMSANGSGVLKSIIGSGGTDSLVGSAGNDTIDGGNGNDTIVASTGDDALVGGEGDDTFSFETAGDFTTADTVTGGAGTDTLSITSADAGTVSSGTSNASNVTDVERLSISDTLAADINATRFEGLSTVRLAGGTNTITGNIAVTNLVGPATVIYAGAGATAAATDTLTPSLKANGAADTLTVSISSTDATASLDFGNLNAADFESVAITSSRGSANTTTTLNSLDLTAGTGTTSVTIGGAVALSTTIASTVVSSIDASANTAGVNITATASAVSNTITGTSTQDTISAGAGSDSINGGDGNDVLSGGAGADTILGGAGEDTIDGGAGVDSIVGGGSNDVILASAGADDVNGGDGTDTYVLSAAYTNVSGVTLTSVEVLDAQSYNFTIAPTQLAALTSVSNGSGTATLSAASTSITSKSGLTKYQLADGTNTFTQRNLSTDEAITVTGGSGSDTFNISSTYLASTDAINGVSGTDVLNVTGNTAIAAGDLDAVTNIDQILFNNTTTNVTITAAATLAAATTGVTIDASGLTSGVLNFSGAAEDGIGAETGFFVVVGGSSGDVIVGSAQADVISTGLGDDAITGAGGIDTLTGGSGSDTFLFNSTATANRDIITDFTFGTGGDVLKFDISDLDLAGGTIYVGAIAGVAADSSEEILVLTGAGYASDDLAEDAVAAQVTTTGLDVVIVYFNTATNKVHIIHDVNAGVDGADGTATLIGVLENVTTLGGLATAVSTNIGTQG